MINRRRYLTNGAVFIIIFSSILFYAHSDGMTGTTQLNGNGCNCHSLTASTQVEVTIYGPGDLQPNETGDYLVSVKGGPLVAAGVNIAASAGSLNPLGGLQKINGELTHTAPKTSGGDSVVFNFTYTAPAEAGQILLYATANSVNLDGSNSGDRWSFSPQKFVTINAATDVEDELFVKSFKLEQNYPNPFNPSTNISFEIPEDASGQQVKLKVYDLLGKEVAEVVNETRSAGNYNIQFDAAKLNSGVYFYQLQAGNYSAIKKMILMK